MNRRVVLCGLLVLLGPGCGAPAPAIDERTTAAAPITQVAPLQTAMATATSVPNFATPSTAPPPAAHPAVTAAVPRTTQ